jgi:hypothetical protein
MKTAIGELRGDLGTIKYVLTPFIYFLYKTQTIAPKNEPLQLGDAFEDTTFKPGFEIVKL